ncbi:MAG TPA: hypothetical protein VFL82_02055 [Thermomicrobiales bacterium]|nr:hypothetical protein [Thermomicrobiales bacterium]
MSSTAACAAVASGQRGKIRGFAPAPWSDQQAMDLARLEAVQLSHRRRRNKPERGCGVLIFGLVT